MALRSCRVALSFRWSGTGDPSSAEERGVIVAARADPLDDVMAAMGEAAKGNMEECRADGDALVARITESIIAHRDSVGASKTCADNGQMNARAGVCGDRCATRFC